MSESIHPEEPRDEQFELGFDALQRCNLPGLGDLWADVMWVSGHNSQTKASSEPDDLDRAFSERRPIRYEDIARINPEVKLEAAKVKKAFSEVIYALGGLLQAEAEFYKTFEDVRYSESKNGGLDMSDIESPGNI